MESLPRNSKLSQSLHNVKSAAYAKSAQLSLTEEPHFLPPPFSDDGETGRAFIPHSSAMLMRKERMCYNCGQEIPAGRPRDGEESYFCSDPCYQNLKDLFWVRARAKALARSGGHCENHTAEGFRCNGTTGLQVHHIIPVGTFYWLHDLHHITNLIVLCEHCHTATKFKEYNPQAMAHHNAFPRKISLVSFSNKGNLKTCYDVPPNFRVLSPGVLLKRFDRVRDCLAREIGLSSGQREIVLGLLKLWAYYGKVYPKANFMADMPGCSSRTFWRALHVLEEQGLVQVANQFIKRANAKISNLYNLTKLVILIAKYLATHGGFVLQSRVWFGAYIFAPIQKFWGWFDNFEPALAAPEGGTP